MARDNLFALKEAIAITKEIVANTDDHTAWVIGSPDEVCDFMETIYRKIADLTEEV